MSFQQRLPPELWEIILDLAIEAGINPIAQCNFLSFPYIITSLRSDDTQALLDKSYEHLRLVCRMFKDLLGPSPRFFMKDSSKIPPRKSRALYIKDDNVSHTWLGLPMAGQRNHPNITMLDIVCFISKTADCPAAFDTLCKTSPALPNLRNLTLRLKQATSTHSHNPIWSRINGAFPKLTGLIVIIADRKPTLPLLPEQELVIFQSLELLDIDKGMVNHGLLAPSLRHISLGFWLSDQRLITGSPLLESILIGHLLHGENIDLRSLSRLRLLGMRQSDAASLLMRNRFPPLSHLWIYTEASNLYSGLFNVINMVSKWMPTVSRITIDTSSFPTADRIGLVKALETCYAVRTGIFIVRSGVLYDGGHIKLEMPVVALP